MRLKHFQRAVHPAEDWRAFCELRELIRSVRPDLVHLHSSKDGFVGRFAINGRKNPLFYTPHGYSFLMSDCSAAKCFAYKTLEFLAGRGRCKTIATSHGEYEVGCAVSKDCTWIDNGVDINELDRILTEAAEEAARNAGPIKVFTIARICQQKNPTLFNEIAGRFPELMFYWIGDGELRHKLASPNIQVLGWMERPEALLAMREMDVFLFLSLWEGLPYALLEAMYLKKLCIVSDVVGNRDGVKSGRNGFLCACLDDYVTALKQVQRQGIPMDWIQNARDDIDQIYNVKAMAEQHKK